MVALLCAIFKKMCYWAPFKGEVHSKIVPIFYRLKWKSSVIRIQQKKRIKKYWFLTKLELLEFALFRRLQKRKFGLWGRALPLMTSSGAKKLILAEFYGFSGLRKALFWKNCLGSFITVRLSPMQKRTLNSKIVVSLSQN